MADSCAQGLDDRQAELGQIIGSAAGDEVAVSHHWQILVLGSRVDQVIADSDKARGSLPGHDARGDQNPGSVADRRQHLAVLMTLSHKVESLLVTA